MPQTQARKGERSTAREWIGFFLLGITQMSLRSWQKLAQNGSESQHQNEPKQKLPETRQVIADNSEHLGGGKAGKKKKNNNISSLLNKKRSE